MATIEDVAQAVGVAQSTVSGAFSGKKRMSPQRREEILRVARELDYQPNLLAQRLREKGSSDSVTVFTTTDFGQETRTLRVLLDLLEEQGINADCNAPPRRGENVHQRQIAELNRARRFKPRAIVISLPAVHPDGLIEELKRFVRDAGILVCYTNGDPIDFADCVTFDRYESTYGAIRYLLEQGHRKIGFNSHGNRPDNDARLRALETALREFDVPFNPQWVWKHCCYEAAGLALGRDFLALGNRPTALHIINDMTAAAFINVLWRAGLRVPDDVSVIGNEDAPIASAALVPLTTSRFPVEALAKDVAELLISRLKDGYDGAPRQRKHQAELILRGSVAPLEKF